MKVSKLVLALAFLLSCKPIQKFDATKPAPQVKDAAPEITQPEVYIRVWEKPAGTSSDIAGQTNFALAPARPLMRHQATDALDALGPSPQIRLGGAAGALGRAAVPDAAKRVAAAAARRAAIRAAAAEAVAAPVSLSPTASAYALPTTIASVPVPTAAVLRPVNFQRVFTQVSGAGPGVRLDDGAGSTFDVTQRFGGGALNSGVFSVEATDRSGGPAKPMVLRFEERGQPTAAQEAAQAFMRGNARFAQIHQTGEFTTYAAGRSKRMVGQVMELGGSSLAQESKASLQPVAQSVVADVLQTAADMGASGIVNFDIKAQNMVYKGAGKQHAMVIDHADALDVRKLRGGESIGPTTFLPPESIAGVHLGPGAKSYDYYSVAVGTIQKRVRGNPEAARQMTDWLHGHVIYQALTGKNLNYHGRLGAEAYPSKAQIMRDLQDAAAVEGNQWLRGREGEFASLLHPNPAQRAHAADVLSRLNANAAVAATPDWQ